MRSERGGSSDTDQDIPLSLDAAVQQLALAQRELKDTVEQLRALTLQFLGEAVMPRYRVGRLRRLLGIHVGRLWHYPSRVLRIPRHYSETAPPPNPPTISLVTPSFNGADFLSRTLDSVLGQKYPALEYVVQDGGSTDGTVAILERYGRDLHRWVSRPDRGQAHAVNLGFEGTTGEIMGYLNSDDVLLPGSLAYVAQFFAEHAEADVVYGHRVIIDAHDGEIGRWVLPPHDDRVLSWADFIPQETMFWRRRVWDRVGGVDESFRFALDWDLILRFRDAKARFVRLPRFLGGFRFHAQQKTLLQLRTIGECEMQRLRHRCHGTAVGLVEVRHAIRWYLIRSAVFQHLYALGLYRC